MRPKVGTQEIRDAVTRLDSIAGDIKSGKFQFDEATRYISQDKDSRNNKGILVNPNTGSSRFEMSQLPPEIAAQVEKMQPGEISNAFIMKDERKNQDVAAIVKLTSRIPGHSANLSEDYNLAKQMYENSVREETLKNWVEKKIKETYVRIEDGWDGCDFKYSGWIK